jgi:chromosome segregation ATPase
MLPHAARARLPDTAATILAWDFLTLCAISLLASSTVCAQTLEDFRIAAGKRGVESIPFPRLNAEANSIARDVEDRKKAATQIQAATLTKQKDNLLWEVQKTQEQITKKEQEISDFKRDHPDGFTGPLEEDLKELQEALTDQRRQVDEKNREIEAGADAWRRFWNARGGLREVFDDVLRELDAARSSPGTYLGSSPSAGAIDSLNRYIDAIKIQIQSEVPEHLKQENGAIDTWNELRKLLEKDTVA